MFLNRILGVITHDSSGNPIRLSSRGAPAARQFMDETPILGAIANAIHDACGVRMTELPITPEKILRGIRAGETDGTE